jgi:hypothetical protein
MGNSTNKTLNKQVELVLLCSSQDILPGPHYLMLRQLLIAKISKILTRLFIINSRWYDTFRMDQH